MIEPPFKLTPAQKKWWDWAIAGHEDMLSDPDTLLDLPEFATSEHLHRLDMLYRFENQGMDIADAEHDHAAIRVLDQFARKLRQVWNIPEECWLDLTNE